MSSAARIQGTIIRMLFHKGFGFVLGADGLTYFMHVNDVVPRLAFDTMRDGQTVEFLPVSNTGKGNGLSAEDVRCI